MKIYLPKVKMIPIIVLVLMFVLKNSYLVRNNDTLTNIFENLEMIIYLLMICVIVRSGYKIKQFFFMGIIALLLAICYLSSGQADLLKACIVIVYLNGVGEKELFVHLNQTFLISFIVVLLLYICGMSDPGIGRRNGFTLGFSTTNIASRMIQCIFFTWILSKRDRLNLSRESIAAFIFAGFILGTTGSRSSAIIVAVLPFLIWYTDFLLRRNKKVLLWILSMTPIFFFAITIITSYQYKNSAFIQFINSAFLSNRVYMNYVAFDKFGIGWLGQAVNISSLTGIFDSISAKYVNFLTIDSQYTYLAVYFGIIGTTIWMVANLLTFYKSVKEKNATLIAVLLVLNFYALTETIPSIFVFLPLMYLLVKPCNSNQGTEKEVI